MDLLASLLLAAWTTVVVAPATSNSIQRRSVDMMELNHFIDPNGREVYKQIIFYDWSPAAQRFHVRSWRLIKDTESLPTQHWKPNHYRHSWVEGSVPRMVMAAELRETWTQEDPERINRRYLPEQDRIPLFGNLSRVGQLRLARP